jgi:hypothetical protein
MIVAQAEEWEQLALEGDVSEGAFSRLNGTVSSLSFSSVVGDASRLPAALRVHRESRAMILPLYPVFFGGDYAGRAKARWSSRSGILTPSTSISAR